MRLIIKNAAIVNEGCVRKGHILVADDCVFDILDCDSTESAIDSFCADEVIDAEGCYALPGVIDTHVHFREPGLTHKATIESESRAAAYGGVTTYFEMPNTNPQTTTLEALEEKCHIAERDSHVNYSFFFGATNDNVDTLQQIDWRKVPGIKLFMGSSTGNMLVDSDEALNKLFSKASELQLPVMAHCEDTAIINRNMEQAKEKYTDSEIPVAEHPLIRSVEACYESSAKAVELATKHGARLHVAHVTTAKELSLFGNDDNITAEVTPAHLLFSDADYADKGAMIKCNPAVKSMSDRDALRNALKDGKISTIATDHAPHLISEKQGGAAKAVSGMPSLQFSLVAMLKLVDEGVMSIERMVELMSHNPARLFSVTRRGYLRKGYKADIVIVRKCKEWILAKHHIQSKCGWSPMEGMTFNWNVVHTICNGHHIYNNGVLDETYRGEAVRFRE